MQTLNDLLIQIQLIRRAAEIAESDLINMLQRQTAEGKVTSSICHHGNSSLYVCTQCEQEGQL